ncbi:MAG: hypothetical protein ACRC7R_09095 [Sarcina sp.]
MALIKVLNKSSVKIDVQIYYTQKTQKEKIKVVAPSFGPGEHEVLLIPDDSTSVNIRVLLLKADGTFKEAASKSFKVVKDRCYEVLGNQSSLKFNEVSCKGGSREDFIYFQNQAIATMKCELIYTVGKEGFKSEGPPISKKGDGMAFSMPKEAEFIQFKIYFLEQNGTWTVVQNFVLKNRPIRKCYVSTNSPGKKPPILISEVKCPNISGLLSTVGVVNTDNNLTSVNPVYPQNPNCNCGQ